MRRDHPILDVIPFWFSFDRPVGRGAYALTGFGLMAAKYIVDSTLVLFGTGQVWTPFDYFVPRLLIQWSQFAESNLLVMTVLLLWSVPFIWIGASMTMRRALDAGFSGLTGLLFFVPIVNYVWMLSLCWLPSVREEPPACEPTSAVTPEPPRQVGAITRAAIPAAVLGVAVAAFSIFGARSYGAVMFVGTPFAVGFTAGYRVRRLGAGGLLEGVLAGQLALLLACGLLLIFALEGVLCLAMAAPLAGFLALAGSLLGAGTARQPVAGAAQILIMFAALPVLLGAELLRPPPPLREVVSTIEIEAPPERVWENVIGFSDLPPPSRLVFALGIAHPVRARIDGRGVGAVRHCEFSTGAFVEPITVWDEPRRLSFVVSEQPAPMHEWSPYQTVNAPHLLEGLVSQRGEFRLTRLPGGRTHLEGSTWYTLDMKPGPYWSLWSDALIHRIHDRVLEHVKALSEARS